MSEKEIKCIVWDLDDTIWEGTLIETDNVKLKPGIVDILKELDSRGIINSIASKNHYDTVIEKLNEFGIKEYFLYPEITWDSKSSSIGKIRNNLNIGIDSMLFIDDQPFERDEVTSVYADITCMDAIDYKDLPTYPRLNPKSITEDAKRRRMMYMEDIQRKVDEEQYIGPQEKFLTSLNMQFNISCAEESDLKRAEELTFRTNQLNSTGKTYGYDELSMYINSEKYKLIVCELKDKYGSYGKIGLALIELCENSWHIKLILMSCRVMSRGVGTILISTIMQYAKQNVKKLLAEFKNTGRNKMMYISYKFANFKEIYKDDEGNILFESDLSYIPKYPRYIEVNSCLSETLNYLCKYE